MVEADDCPAPIAVASKVGRSSTRRASINSIGISVGDRSSRGGPAWIDLRYVEARIGGADRSNASISLQDC